jgi:hypothetical protein
VAAHILVTYFRSTPSPGCLIRDQNRSSGVLLPEIVLFDFSVDMPGIASLHTIV